MRILLISWLPPLPVAMPLRSLPEHMARPCSWRIFTDSA
jgi:hypothetical protein